MILKNIIQIFKKNLIKVFNIIIVFTVGKFHDFHIDFMQNV